MKNQKLILITLLYLCISCLTFSCFMNKGTTNSKNTSEEAKEINIADYEIESNFNESLKLWNELKVQNGNSYEYSIGYFSFVGYRSTVTVTVENGEVVNRSYSETKQRDGGGFEQMESIVYVEDKSDLNTHEQGPKAVTFDEIYATCGNNTLQVDLSRNKIYFSTDDEGLLKGCTYIENGCMDDCSVGVNVSSFEWLD